MQHLAELAKRFKTTAYAAKTSKKSSISDFINPIFY